MGKKIVMPKLNKISSQTLEAIRKETSEFIYVEDKEGHARCERCNNEFILPKTKHLEKDVKCPHCKAKMQVVHKWRRKYEASRIYWRVVATAVDSKTLVLRYIISVKDDKTISRTQEVAREVFNFEKQKTYSWEYHDRENEWKRTHGLYFTEHFMYHYRKECCLQADIHNLKTFVKEIKKIEYFKYVDIVDILLINTHYVSSLIANIYKNALVYEQLQKAGYQQLVISDYNEYHDNIKYYPQEKSLGKKIGLLDRTFKMLKKYQTIDNYAMLKSHPDITEAEFEFFVNGNWKSYEIDAYFRNGLKLKQARYIVANKIEIREYIHYLSLCRDLQYPENDYYLYPKDFKQMDLIVSDEYMKQKDKIAYEMRQKNSELIHKVSIGLQNLPEIKSLMNGSNGLLVYIPDSADDLSMEGKNQNNCVGTYVERIAKKQTLVFFIRQLNNPTASFVTMEMSYKGEVHQVMYKGNKRVDDDNIINFVDKLSQIVKKHSNELQSLQVA